jgi:4-hydroxyacetophenone monooxygenase
MASAIEPLQAQFDELTVARALKFANANALRIALYQATGDLELTHMAVRREPYWAGAYEVLTLSPEDTEKVLAKAMAYMRSGIPSRCPAPSDEQIRHLMHLFTGQEVNEYIYRFGTEELNFERFPRGVQWTAGSPAALKDGFHVLIVGAGVAGLVTAIQLDRLGIPFTIVERNADVGGTWWTNDYPDARVDVPSHHYQLSVTQNYPWKHWFATQPELLQYIRHITDKYNLRGRIRFNTELTGARWDERAKHWQVELRKREGQTQTITSNVVISAAGLFNEPNRPDIPGIDGYRGTIFHTTAWDHSFDYTNKRVGIIGVGCTGAQLMPRVAKDAALVKVFQRSPNWVAKLDGYRDEIPADVQWLMDNIPHYWNWFVFSVFHTLYASDGALQAIDNDWRREGGLVSPVNDRLRRNIESYIVSQFPDDADMVRKLTPTWPPFAKRLVVDNGWFEALKRPNVKLVTEGIERITADGIVTKDGVEHALDMIVVAGGFKVERYLWPVRYEGRQGKTLESAWLKDGARAYLGITLPDFPNFFVIYGPNAQARAGGLFAWLEIWARYSVQAVVSMLESGHRSMECRRDVHDSYNARLDAADKDCIWGMEGLKSYYVNGQGRQGINNPLRPSVAYELVRKPNLADFILD